MNFGNAVASAYKNAFNYGGRSTRSEYWWFVLFGAIVSLLVVVAAAINAFGSIPDNATDDEALRIFVRAIAVAVAICWLLAGVPLIALAFRRLHDMGQPGWWVGISTAIQLAVTVMTFTDASFVSSSLLSTLLSGVMNILQLVVLVMAIMPSQPFANKYGPANDSTVDAGDVPPPPPNFERI